MSPEAVSIRCHVESTRTAQAGGQTSPQYSPNTKASGLWGSFLRSNNRGPRDTAQPPPVLLSCHRPWEKHNCLNASFVNNIASCDDVCPCMAASQQAVSTQLRSCFYKVRAVTNSAVSKHNHTTSPSTALPAA